MGLINGNTVAVENIVIPQYRWVKVSSGTVTERVKTILVSEVNGTSRNFYGVAFKYTAPKRSDSLSKNIFVQLVKLRQSSGGTPSVEYTVFSNQIMGATLKSNTTYGQCIADGSYGMYRGYWFVGGGTPIADHAQQNIHPLHHYFGCESTDELNANGIRIKCSTSTDDDGNVVGGLEEGTTYEIWGLVKEVQS